MPAPTVDPGRFSKSPTIAVIVIDEKQVAHTFHLHQSLLAQHSRRLSAHLKDTNGAFRDSMPDLEVRGLSCGEFQIFVWWLYGHVFTPTLAFRWTSALHSFSKEWRLHTFAEYLLKDFVQHYVPSDWVLLLEISAFIDKQAISEELVDFSLDKMAYEITTRGWENFAEEAGDIWTKFIDPERASADNRGRYLAKLMPKLGTAEELRSEDKLIDPVTNFGKWYPPKETD